MTEHPGLCRCGGHHVSVIASQPLGSVGEKPSDLRHRFARIRGAAPPNARSDQTSTNGSPRPLCIHHRKQPASAATSQMCQLADLRRLVIVEGTYLAGGGSAAFVGVAPFAEAGC